MRAHNHNDSPHRQGSPLSTCCPLTPTILRQGTCACLHTAGVWLPHYQVRGQAQVDPVRTHAPGHPRCHLPLLRPGQHCVCHPVLQGVCARCVCMHKCMCARTSVCLCCGQVLFMINFFPPKVCAHARGVCGRSARQGGQKGGEQAAT